MNKNQKIIFISWTKYARHSDLLAKALGAEIYFIDNFINSRGLVWKLFFFSDYLVKTFKTFKIILNQKPDFVFVQNPPSLTPIVVIILSRILRFKVVVDSHNGAFEKPWVSIPLHRWSLERAQLVIIHNAQLLNNLKNTRLYDKISFKILNSRLSEFYNLKNEKDEEQYFLVITSFAADEPVFELLKGIMIFNASNNFSITFKITGNYKKNPQLYNQYSQEKNIEFLGFVNDEDYKRLLVNAFGAIALSTRNDVQQFALMEAVGAEVPFISSRNSTNESLFGVKMVLTENKANDISKGLEIFVKNHEKLYNNIREIKQSQTDKWNHDFNQVKTFLGIS